MGSHYCPSVISAIAEEIVRNNPVRHGLSCGRCLFRIAGWTERFPATASTCAGTTYKSTRNGRAVVSRASRVGDAGRKVDVPDAPVGDARADRTYDARGKAVSKSDVQFDETGHEVSNRN